MLSTKIVAVFWKDNNMSQNSQHEKDNTYDK